VANLGKHDRDCGFTICLDSLGDAGGARPVSASNHGLTAGNACIPVVRNGHIRRFSGNSILPVHEDRAVTGILKC